MTRTHNVDEFYHKKQFILCDSIYRESPNKQNRTMLLELGTVVTVKVYRSISWNVCFLLWALVTQICSDCENLVSCIPMYVYFSLVLLPCIFYFNLKIKQAQQNKDTFDCHLLSATNSCAGDNKMNKPINIRPSRKPFVQGSGGDRQMQCRNIDVTVRLQLVIASAFIKQLLCGCYYCLPIYKLLIVHHISFCL